MGMAHRAPMDTYSRKLQIAAHAILRLRERLEVEGLLEHRSDADIGNLLDDAVAHAFAHGAAEDSIGSDGEPCWLVDLESHFNSKLSALVKPHEDRRTRRRDPAVKVVVSVMQTEWIEKLKAQGKWGTEQKPLGTLGDRHGDRLAAHRADAEIAHAAKSATPPAIRRAPTVAAVPAPPSVKADVPPIPDTGTVIVVYKDTDGKDRFQRCLATHYKDIVTALIEEGVDTGGIEIAIHPRPLKVRRVIEID